MNSVAVLARSPELEAPLGFGDNAAVMLVTPHEKSIDEVYLPLMSRIAGG